MLKYLAPYVYRVAISDNRIESVDDDGVTYRVKPSGKNYYVDRRLTGQQFVARSLSTSCRATSRSFVTTVS